MYMKIENYYRMYSKIMLAIGGSLAGFKNIFVCLISCANFARLILYESIVRVMNRYYTTCESRLVHNRPKLLDSYRQSNDH